MSYVPSRLKFECLRTPDLRLMDRTPSAQVSTTSASGVTEPRRDEHLEPPELLPLRRGGRSGDPGSSSADVSRRRHRCRSPFATAFATASGMSSVPPVSPSSSALPRLHADRKDDGESGATLTAAAAAGAAAPVDPLPSVLQSYHHRCCLGSSGRGRCRRLRPSPR